MPRGQTSGHTDKQKRQAQHIEQSERDAGKDKANAERIDLVTANERNNENNIDHERQRHGDRH